MSEFDYGTNNRNRYKEKWLHASFMIFYRLSVNIIKLQYISVKKKRLSKFLIIEGVMYLAENYGSFNY